MFVTRNIGRGTHRAPSEEDECLWAFKGNMLFPLERSEVLVELWILPEERGYHNGEEE